LGHLCEFIEDCEFTKLAVRILHLLGTEGPTTATPNKYIRYIYNRVILENATVRAAAVSALGRFAVALPDLRPSISVLLDRCLDDSDDEVRDRAAWYLRVLKDEALSKKYVKNGKIYFRTYHRLYLLHVSSLPLFSRSLSVFNNSISKRHILFSHFYRFSLFMECTRKEFSSIFK